MLRWRPGAARHLQLAIEGLSDGDRGILERELATDAQGLTSGLRSRRRELMLLDASRMLQATHEHSLSVSEELSVVMGTEALPSATADGHDEMHATALRVGLECLSRLILVGRSSVSEEDTAGDCSHPYEIFCGNALRVVSTLREAALREKRFPRPKPDEGCAAESTLPSQLELLKAARFCVLCSNTSRYAHISLEPPTDRSSDSALVYDNSNRLSRLKSTTANEMKALGADAEKPQPLIILAGTGDVLAGDELALVLCRTLSDLKLIELRAVIVTRGPGRWGNLESGTLAGRERASRLARGTLDALDMDYVPVAIGSDISDAHATDALAGGSTPKLSPLSPTASVSSFSTFSTFSTFDEPSSMLAVGAEGYMLRPPDGGKAPNRLLEEFTRATDDSLTLLVTTALSDLAAFIQAHTAEFKKKARRIVVLGDVEAASLNSDTSVAGALSSSNTPSDEAAASVPGYYSAHYLRPNLSSPNFALDPDAAKCVFCACQDLDVQLIVLSAAATAAAPLPSFMYDELATLAHPVALRLRESHRAALQALWGCASAPQGLPIRRGFAENRAWFSRSFCGGADLSAIGEDRLIWPYVKEFNLLDPLGLLACHPATLEAFYEPDVKELQSVEHMVIGMSADRPGVRDCAKLRSYILDGCRHALSESLAHALALQSARSPSAMPKRRNSSNSFTKDYSRNG